MYELLRTMVSGERVWQGVAAAVLVGAAAPALAVPIPYFEDFDDAAEGLTESKSHSAASTWTLAGGAYQHTLAAPGTGIAQYAGAVVFGNELAKPNDFVVQVTFNVSDVSGSSGAARVGLVGLAKSSTELGQYTSNSLYYAVDLVVGGGAGDNVNGLTIKQGRASNTQLALASVTLPSFSLNTNYTMTFIGDYNEAGDLTLTAKVGDVTVTAPTILAADVIDPGGGRYFGIRDFVSNGRNLTVTYDDLSITNVVPEPAAAALMGLGSLFVVSRRRSA